MTLLYSPIDGSEMPALIRPQPRSAFLMLHDNDRVAAVESQMQEIVRAELAATRFVPKTASEVRRSGDFLAKIIELIRGCGFGIAIFSDATPPKTLANIFFEIGYCLALGKPTFLVQAGDAAPSDFVRSEWINFDTDRVEQFRSTLRSAFNGIEEYGIFLGDLGRTAEEAEEVNLEVAMERFRRAYLVTGSTGDLDGIRRIQTRLRVSRSDADLAHLIRAPRRSLLDDISQFLRLAEKVV